ncbi:MAG: hypothetical protein VB111_00390 [Clostridiaceae bacterium]|nr:hypothetical protein [Clostridiaceae bacterium]
MMVFFNNKSKVIQNNKARGDGFLKNVRVIAVVLVLMIVLSACTNSSSQENLSTSVSDSSGQIYLYGEVHNVDKILDKELELWREYYNQGMRHLFVELSYYTAEFLNLWMQSDSDVLLDEVYKDWAYTATHDPDVKEFYGKIKRECPETVFHGTDVGHQYDTTGKRFLKYLKENGLENTDQYSLTQENIEQGQYYYLNSDDVYRENKMAENFIREFDKLEDENVMGIYGAAHTDPNAMDYMTRSVQCMANQLKTKYGDNLYSEDLSSMGMEPDATGTITVDGKDWQALYYGKQDMSSFSKEYVCREFWRLENAYEDFQDKPKTGDLLPYNNYPMPIDKGQVFMIDYIKADQSVVRKYYRSDGNLWDAKPITEEFTLE